MKKLWRMTILTDLFLFQDSSVTPIIIVSLRARLVPLGKNERVGDYRSIYENVRSFIINNKRLTLTLCFTFLSSFYPGHSFRPLT